jgi:hypothetical protein
MISGHPKSSVLPDHFTQELCNQDFINKRYERLARNDLA